MYDGDPSIDLLTPLSVEQEVKVRKITKIEVQERHMKISESGWALGKGNRKSALAIARIRERTWPFRVDEIPEELNLPEMSQLREYPPVYTHIAGRNSFCIGFFVLTKLMIYSSWIRPAVRLASQCFRILNRFSSSDQNCSQKSFPKSFPRACAAHSAALLTFFRRSRGRSRNWRKDDG